MMSELADSEALFVWGDFCFRWHKSCVLFSLSEGLERIRSRGLIPITLSLFPELYSCRVLGLLGR